MGCGHDARSFSSSGSTPASGGTSGVGGSVDPATGGQQALGGAGGAGSDDRWATGGTVNLSGNYPEPFPNAPEACLTMAPSTEGPCLEDVDLVRKDISEGYTGLPMRLSLLVVDETCQPISGAKVKVWHTQISGSYSGDPPTNYPCLLDPTDVTKHYFRGVQTTNESGRVDFDSCFPGWYPVRAIHIHFTVSVGSAKFTSQWGFSQQLVDDIYETQPEYAAYGPPPVKNSGDGVLVGIGEDGFMLDASRQEDGALLASKVVVFPG